MRISIILLFIFSFFTLASAQEEGSQYKVEKPKVEQSEYLPKAGDIGIGFDATPFLDYIGNVANGTMNNSLGLGDNTLYFRYFLSDNSAVRVKVRINSEKDVDHEYVADDQARVLDPLSQKEVKDRRVSKYTETELNVGYQVFRGSNRLRGFYGGDFGFGFEKEKNIYEYGNKMSALNASPSTGFGLVGSPRVLEELAKSNTFVGLGAFTGAEYYFMPKACIGVELGVTYYHTFDKQTNLTQEKMVISEYVVEDITGDAAGRARDFNTTMPYSYGNLYLMIQF